MNQRILRSLFYIQFLAAAISAPSAAFGGEPGIQRFTLGKQGEVTAWLVTESENPGAVDVLDPQETVPGANPSWRLFVSDGTDESGLGAEACSDFTRYRTRPGSIWGFSAFRMDEPATVEILVQSYVPFQLWLDGRERINRPPTEAAWTYDGRLKEELTAGRHRFLIKLLPGSGPPCFTLSVRTAAGEPVANTRAELALNDISPVRQRVLLAQAIRLSLSGETGPFLTAERDLTLRVQASAGLPEVGQDTWIFSVPARDLKDRPIPNTTSFGKVKLADLRTTPQTALFKQTKANPNEPIDPRRSAAVRFSLTATAGDTPEDVPFVVRATAYDLESMVAWASDQIRSVETERKTGRTVPLARLKVEKVLLSFVRIRAGGRPDASWAAGVLRELLAGDEALSAERDGRDPLAERTGTLERAYYDSVDDSTQPYLLYVPQSYRADRNLGGWPLVVLLHGYVPSYNKDRWMDIPQGLAAACEAQNVFMALPFGRSNTDFLTIGETDVMNVIAEMKRIYGVADDRISLLGYSMGGSGVYTMCAHHPDRFSAAYVISGRCDYYTWFPEIDRAKLEPWRRFMIAADNPADQWTNLHRTPFYIVHGDADTLVQPAHSRLAAEQLAKGKHVPILEMIPNGSHFVFSDRLNDAQPVTWLKPWKRHSESGRFSMVSYGTRYAQHPQCTVTHARTWDAPISVESREEADGWILKVSNVARMELYGAKEKKVTVVAEEGGKYNRIHREAPRPADVFTREDFKEPKRAKTPQLSGPLKEALTTPFVIVYGANGTLEQQTASRESAQHWAETWFRFTKSAPRIVADNQLSPEDRVKFTLVLVGPVSANQVLRDVLPSLPVTLDDTSVRWAGDRYELSTHGLLLTYPSPFADQSRYVVVSAGLPWGQGLSVNHQWDFVPDYAIYRASDPVAQRSAGTWSGENCIVRAGFFDPEWNYAPKLDWKIPDTPPPAQPVP